MFGLFKSKPKGIPVIDKVWMSKAAKYNACVAMLGLQPSTLFIAWFDETLQEARSALQVDEGSQTIMMADKVTAHDAQNRMVVFLEHHPLVSVEQAVFMKLGLNEVPVLSSLDEGLFMMFGGERTIEIMQRLGMKDDEVVGHTMITRSIRRAQDKLESKFISNSSAKSQAEWLAKNVRK